MGGLGGGLRSASAQCGVVKRDVTNCLKERAEAALNCFCATGDTLAAWPHPPGLPAFRRASLVLGVLAQHNLCLSCIEPPHTLAPSNSSLPNLEPPTCQLNPYVPRTSTPNYWAHKTTQNCPFGRESHPSSPSISTSASQKSGVLVWITEEDRLRGASDLRWLGKGLPRGKRSVASFCATPDSGTQRNQKPEWGQETPFPVLVGLRACCVTSGYSPSGASSILQTSGSTYSEPGCVCSPCPEELPIRWVGKALIQSGKQSEIHQVSYSRKNTEQCGTQ